VFWAKSKLASMKLMTSCGSMERWMMWILFILHSMPVDRPLHNPRSRRTRRMFGAPEPRATQVEDRYPTSPCVLVLRPRRGTLPRRSAQQDPTSTRSQIPSRYRDRRPTLRCTEQLGDSPLHQLRRELAHGCLHGRVPFLESFHQPVRGLGADL